MRKTLQTQWRIWLDIDLSLSVSLLFYFIPSLSLPFTHSFSFFYSLNCSRSVPYTLYCFTISHSLFHYIPPSSHFILEYLAPHFSSPSRIFHYLFITISWILPPLSLWLSHFPNHFFSFSRLLPVSTVATHSLSESYTHSHPLSILSSIYPLTRSFSLLLKLSHYHFSHSY